MPHCPSWCSLLSVEVAPRSVFSMRLSLLSCVLSLGCVGAGAGSVLPALGRRPTALYVTINRSHLLRQCFVRRGLRQTAASSVLCLPVRRCVGSFGSAVLQRSAAAASGTAATPHTTPRHCVGVTTASPSALCGGRGGAALCVRALVGAGHGDGSAACRHYQAPGLGGLGWDAQRGIMAQLCLQAGASLPPLQ